MLNTVKEIEVMLWLLWDRVKSEDGYTSVGKVGTGFSEADLINLTNILRRYVENYSSGVYSFSPSVVLEVKADLISRDEKGTLV